MGLIEVEVLGFGYFEVVFFFDYRFVECIFMLDYIVLGSSGIYFFGCGVRFLFFGLCSLFFSGESFEWE